MYVRVAEETIQLQSCSIVTYQPYRNRVDNISYSIFQLRILPTFYNDFHSFIRTAFCPGVNGN